MINSGKCIITEFYEFKASPELIKESEEAYNSALERNVNEKELDRLEKNYKDSLKLMRTYNQINNKKK